MPEPWTWLGRVWLCHFGQRPTSFLGAVPPSVKWGGGAGAAMCPPALGPSGRGQPLLPQQVQAATVFPADQAGYDLPQSGTLGP